MRAPYFPFYPQDWLSDPRTAQLTYEERGIYFELLCRCWTSRDGSCSLPNDDLFISKLLGIRLSKWQKIKRKLSEGLTAVLKIEKNKILNERLLKEFEKIKIKSEINSKNASQKCKNDQAKPLINKDFDLAAAERTLCHTDTDTDTDTDTNILLNLSDDKLRVVGDETPTTSSNVISLKIHTSKDKVQPKPFVNTDEVSEYVESEGTIKVINKNTVPSCPHQEIIDIYHEMLPLCQKVLIWNATRQSHLRQRWREYPEINLWRQFFEIVSRSKFLTGQISNKERKPFVASLDWLVRPNNFVKVLERRYE